MGVRLNRRKERHLLLTFIYRLQRIILLGKEKKFRLFLDLEWIFNRLAHEQSFKVYPPGDHPWRQFTETYLLSLIEPIDKVLDLGCKYGDMSRFLARKAAHVTGIDLDKAAIEAARLKYGDIPNLEFVHAEAFAYLENCSRKFDVLILSHVLEHLDNPSEFLYRFKKFFKKIYVELPDFDSSYHNRYRQKLEMKLIYTDSDHINEFDREELTNLMDKCGLIIEKAEYRFGVQRLWCNTGF